MSNSNFCANCGARLMRKGWRLWMRGTLCDDCARRPGISTRGRTVVIIGLLTAGAFGLGRYLRPPGPPLVIQRAVNSPLSDAPLNSSGLAGAPANSANSPASIASPAADDIVYLCGARTQKGTPCRRRVHVAGERCYQHKGRNAMVPLEKLIVR